MSKFEKEEFAARTIRPKIKKLLPDYLEKFKEEKIKVRAGDLQVNCPDTEVNKQNIADLFHIYKKVPPQRLSSRYL